MDAVGGSVLLIATASGLLHFHSQITDSPFTEQHFMMLIVNMVALLQFTTLYPVRMVVCHYKTMKFVIF